MVAKHWMETKKVDRRELGLEIADEGGWEEFHQKRHNYTMYDHHKNRRLMLERQYKELFHVPSR